MPSNRKAGFALSPPKIATQVLHDGDWVEVDALCHSAQGGALNYVVRGGSLHHSAQGGALNHVVRGGAKEGVVRILKKIGEEVNY